MGFKQVFRGPKDCHKIIRAWNPRRIVNTLDTGIQNSEYTLIHNCLKDFVIESHSDKMSIIRRNAVELSVVISEIRSLYHFMYSILITFNTETFPMHCVKFV